MADTTLMRQAADWIDEHPDEYGYHWSKCVANVVARLTDTPVDVGSWVVETRFRFFTRKSYINEWATKRLGIDYDQAHRLFVVMPGVEHHHDAHEVANFVRVFADSLDK